MGTAAVVAGVLTQLEEVVDVVVPSFEVGAARAATLATLVDGDELVVVQLKEWDDAL